LKEYDRAELRTSDHRPVYAVFDATIREVEHTKKEAIVKDILRSIRQNAAGDEVGIDRAVEKALNGGGVGRLADRLTKRERLSSGISPG
jgi:hypothetical protein